MEFNTLSLDNNFKPKKTFINCSIHGEQVEALLNGNCRLCRDDKSVLEDKQHHEMIITDLKRNSGVSERYLGFILSNYPIENESQATLLEMLNTYEFKQNIVLLGSVGTGKTRLACSLIDKAIRKSTSCYYAKYYQLTKMAIEDKNLFKKISTCGFLVIDEFGVSDTDYKTQLLFELFDLRYDKMLPTMLISNLTTPQLIDKIGNPLYSRIKQDCLSFNCNWHDYRLKSK